MPIDDIRWRGWKGISSALTEAYGTEMSESKCRELADPRRKWQLPVRYDAAGLYLSAEMFSVWRRHFDAPYGAHDELKRNPRSSDKRAEAK